MNMKSILALAILGNTFTFQQVLLTDKEPQPQTQPPPTEQLILQDSTTSDKKANKLINADLSNPFQIKLNQIAIIKSENFKLKFLNVTEDSRCPSDVQCIWAGQVTIVVNVLKNNISLGNYSLINYLGKNKNTIIVDGYSINFINVIPAPKPVGQSIKLSDYVVTIVVSKI